MILRFIFWAFVVYISYRFVFKFLIPVLIATSKIREQIKNSRAQNSGFNNPVKPENSSAPKKEENVTKEGEYIEFEEIK